MRAKHKNISGIILAGGKNSRMGMHKAFLPINGQRFIDIILKLMQTFFDEVLIVADDRQMFAEFSSVKVVEDIIKYRGPLFGIYTGLNNISNPKSFCVACDMPFLSKKLIKKLLTISEQGNYECIVPISFYGIEPLCAIYAKSVMPIIESLLQQKKYAVSELISNCESKYFSYSKDKSSFTNVNTYEDFVNHGRF